MTDEVPADLLAAMPSDDDEIQLRRSLRLAKMAEARLNFAQNHHQNTRGEKMDFKNYPHIVELYNTVAPVIVIQGSVQSFKAQPLSSPVHTPNGWRTMGELKVGDVVSTPDGKDALINGVQDHGVQDVFEFTLSDGRKTRASKDHLWKVIRAKKRKTLSPGRKSDQWNVSSNSEVLTTEQIIQGMKSGEYRFTIPVPTSPVEKPEKSLPLDPYFLGLMLGDGEIHWPNLRISTHDSEIVESVNKAVKSHELNTENGTDYFFVGGPRSLADKFQQLGLLGTYSHTKFIPRKYLEASTSQRMELLRGILDSDGTANGGVDLRSTSLELIKGTQELVFSLGGVASHVKREGYYISSTGERVDCRDYYILTISMPHPSACFKLTRKKEKVSHTHRRLRTLGSLIESVKQVESEEVRCIHLDNEEHLYITDDYIVTHNTEWMIIDHFAAAYAGMSVFFVLPKYEHRNTFVQNRIDRCVENVPFYKQVIRDGFFNNVAMKNFGSGVIKYVGSNVMADFTEFPADIIYCEEVDQCDAKNVEFALDRLRASKFQFKRYVGNPSSVGTGINAYYERSDKREWNVPCTDCGELSPLDWFESVVDAVVDSDGNVVDYVLRDTAWKTGIGRDIKLICPKCGKGELQRAHSQGAWVAESPENEIAGYHFSMMCSPINTISGMWARFQKALNDPAALVQFYNSDLGLPYSAAGNKVTDEVLNRCVEEDYRLVIHPDRAHIKDDRHDGPCSMGIDVGANLDVRISFVEPYGQRRMVFCGKLKSIDEVHELIERYNVEKCVIDSLPEITLSQDFQLHAECDVWLCRYHKQEGTDRRVQYNAIHRILSVDRTAALDRSYAAVKMRKIILPENYKSVLAGEFFKEMTGPVREVIEDNRGNLAYQWTKCKDHQRHADSYDKLAGDMMIESVIDTICVG